MKNEVYKNKFVLAKTLKMIIINRYKYRIIQPVYSNLLTRDTLKPITTGLFISQKIEIFSWRQTGVKLFQLYKAKLISKLNVPMGKKGRRGWELRFHEWTRNGKPSAVWTTGLGIRRIDAAASFQSGCC